MIFHKFWSAFVAQINKVANLFWEADPVAQMRYEYDRAVEQLKEGRGGLEQYRGLVERVTRQALDGLPRPGGGTAIGEALRQARPDLYRAGVFRKYLLVVTDGDNTSGQDPERVAREIFAKSQGAVQVYFVAFDTTPQKFAFLKEVGGDVIGAGTGAELHKALDGIYQGKILAEAPDAGEREPAKK